MDKNNNFKENSRQFVGDETIEEENQNLLNEPNEQPIYGVSGKGMEFSSKLNLIKKINDTEI